MTDILYLAQKNKYMLMFDLIDRFYPDDGSSSVKDMLSYFHSPSQSHTYVEDNPYPISEDWESYDGTLADIEDTYNPFDYEIDPKNRKLYDSIATLCAFVNPYEKTPLNKISADIRYSLLDYLLTTDKSSPDTEEYRKTLSHLDTQAGGKLRYLISNISSVGYDDNGRHSRLFRYAPKAPKRPYFDKDSADITRFEPIMEYVGRDSGSSKVYNEIINELKSLEHDIRVVANEKIRLDIDNILNREVRKQYEHKDNLAKKHKDKLWLRFILGANLYKDMLQSNTPSSLNSKSSVYSRNPWDGTTAI